MNQRHILLLTMIFSCLFAYGQKEVNNWYFGGFAGITFNTSTPTALTNSQLNTSEGCATISDINGSLLFYTDGIKVWDKTHNVTPNGAGLKGHSSSTQSAVVIPRPGNPGKYYIFTVDQTAGNNGLRYSEFNMNLNGGLGDIDTSLKNRPLLSYTCEKISAVKHANNIDFWVCTHKFGTDSIYAFLVTSVGVNTTSVASKTGLVIDSYLGNTLGYMKFSPDGLKLAYANWTLDTSCIADFNLATGRVSNVWKIPINDAYGVEFSAKSKYVYYAEMYSPWNIFQYDAKALNDLSFHNSRISIDQRSARPIGALQLGPDRKIYVCRQGSQFLDVIHAPDSQGTASRIQYDYVDLKGKICSYGLPTFIQSYLKTSFNFSGYCFGDTSWFAIDDSVGLDSVHWDFGDVNSGSFNYATGFKSFHLFSDTGTYKVRTIAFKKDLRDTGYTTVDQLLYLGEFDDLGSEIFKCFDDTMKLSVIKKDNLRYLWSTQSDSFATHVVDSGLVTAKKFFGSKCYAVDTVKISFFPNNHLDGDLSLGPDIYKCPNDSFLMRFFDATATKYIWNNGKTNTSYYEPKTGLVSIKAFYGGSCFRTDTIELFNRQIENFTLGKDTFFCPNQSIYLGYWDAGYSAYLWSTGSKTPFLVPDTGGIYALKVKDENGCFQSDTIKVEALAEPVFSLGKDTFFCDQSSEFVLSPKYHSSFAKYKWNSGKTTVTDTIYKSGKYWLSIENPCAIKTDTIQIKYLTTPTVILPFDSIFCDSINLQLDAQNADNEATWTWNTLEKTQIIQVRDTGLYSVEVANNCGSDKDSIVLSRIYTPNIDLGKDTLFCNEVNLWLKIGKPNNAEHYDWQELNALISLGNTDTLRYQEAGRLFAVIENQCGKAFDTLNVKKLNTPVLSLDTLYEYCQQVNLNLDVTKANNEETYLWSTQAVSDNISIAIPGDYWVKASNDCGFDSTWFQVVMHPYPVFDLGKDSIVCGASDVLLDASCQDPKATYFWRSGERTPQLLVNSDGMYQVTVSNYCGNFYDSIRIEFFKVPYTDLGRDTVFCDAVIPVSKSVPVTNFVDRYLWSNGSTDTATLLSSIGKHWLQITNPCGVYSDSVEFRLSLSPSVNLGPDTVLCGNFVLELNAGNQGMEYLWSPFGETTSSIIAQEQTVYAVTVTNSDGCVGRDEMRIGDNCISNAWFPNSFTPNGDFLNETFKPVLVNFEQFNLKIYNRWGELLFETNDPENAWDGTYNGQPCQIGNYFFIAQFISTEKFRNEYISGTIELLR